jgi:hypothetical protein
MGKGGGVATVSSPPPRAAYTVDLVDTQSFDTQARRVEGRTDEGGNGVEWTGVWEMGGEESKGLIIKRMSSAGLQLVQISTNWPIIGLGRLSADTNYFRLIGAPLVCNIVKGKL